VSSAKNLLKNKAMKPYLYLLFVFGITLNLSAQNFPYLNASTGNANEFIVDADSNIIMFHGSKIEKLDKNFNLIWANSYSGLNFKNVLLSKTGSLFFIAYNTVGKIEANGNLTWCKTLPTYTTVVSANTQTVSIDNAYQLLLDRNNHLVVTGITYNARSAIYLLKLDTLGAFIKLRVFEGGTQGDYQDFEIASLINDVSGIYTIAGWAQGFEGNVYGSVIKYYDINNTVFTNTVYHGDYAGSTNQMPISNSRIFKSKMASNTFYLAYNKGMAGSTLYNTFTCIKMRGTTSLWIMQFQTSSPYLMNLQGIEEDLSKNSFLSVTTQNIYTNKYDKWIIKIDSNGISDNHKHNYLQNLGPDSITRLKHHYGNKYVYVIESSALVPGLLSIIKMDSTIGSYCSPTASISISSSNQYSNTLTPGQTTLTAIPSVTMPSFQSTVTSLSNYSITVNSCIATNLNEHNTLRGFSVYPNPAANHININSSGNDLEQVSVFDINGKCVLTSEKQHNIDVSNLSPGLYFIRIKTNQGEFSHKFIKE
jgi:hypothetical protein